MTNPSTCGVFERQIRKLRVPCKAGLTLLRWANLNAILGKIKPRETHGFRCLHMNLHKTFATPQGGGGPGAGPVGVSESFCLSSDTNRR
ncbi:MAG: hypothetical protein Ct9H90mP27_3340 [Gammaproteobacteria bacterium]|nr:MAG: hypothetical protein Ct9H90mP27_3340 [Gammaproteobacteria bacterium]